MAESQQCSLALFCDRRVIPSPRPTRLCSAQACQLLSDVFGCGLLDRMGPGPEERDELEDGEGEEYTERKRESEKEKRGERKGLNRTAPAHIPIRRSRTHANRNAPSPGAPHFRPPPLTRRPSRPQRTGPRSWPTCSSSSSPPTCRATPRTCTPCASSSTARPPPAPPPGRRHRDSGGRRGRGVAALAASGDGGAAAQMRRHVQRRSALPGRPPLGGACAHRAARAARPPARPAARTARPA
jgi:hypothetical protein